MTDLLTDAIVKTLREDYPKELYPIYTQKVRAAFKVPAFALALEKATFKAGLGRRFSEELTYTLRYYPAEGFRQREEMEKVGCALNAKLGRLETEEGVFTAKDCSFRIRDEVLCWEATYRVYGLLAETSAPLMEKEELKMLTMEKESDLEKEAEK